MQAVQSTRALHWQGAPVRCSPVGPSTRPRARLVPRPAAKHDVDHIQAISVEGKQYIPLSEAKRFFEAGVRSGAAERIEMLEKQMQMLQAERDQLAVAMDEELTVHEEEMKQLLAVALALEAEVEKRAVTLEEVAGAAVQEAEARMGEAFATQLEVMHARDVAEVEERWHERTETMGHALRTALAGKESWRHRAMEAERQLAQLRGQIQSRLEGAQQGVSRVRQHLPRGATWRQVDED